MHMATPMWPAMFTYWYRNIAVSGSLSLSTHTLYTHRPRFPHPQKMYVPKIRVRIVHFDRQKGIRL